MGHTRCGSRGELALFHHGFDKLCSDVFDSDTFSGRGIARRWAPASDLVEGGDEYILSVDLPGLAKEDVKVDVEDGTLTVSGERRSEKEEDENGYQRYERRFGSFKRSLRLQDGVDPGSISATVSKGVLEVRIPKPEASKPYRVDIDVGENGDTIEGDAKESE